MGTDDHPGGDGEKVLKTGWPLFYQQCISLMRKNALISYRNRRATILQIGSSLFFIFLLFCVEKADDAQLSGTTAYKNLFEPQPQAVSSIPACENAYFVVLPCYDFIWSGVTSPRIQSVVNNIMNNNPNRPIPSTKVQHFDTPEEVDAWLLANPMRCYGTLYFEERGTSAIAYGIQTNSTGIYFHGRFSDPNFSYQIPLQVAAEREIARTVLGGRAHYAHWPSLFSPVQEDVIRFPHLMMTSEEFIPPKFCSEKN
jgi:hypothetical protein